MAESRKPINKGDKLIWNSRAGQFQVEAVTDEDEGLVTIKNKGTIAQCPVGELSHDDSSR